MGEGTITSARPCQGAVHGHLTIERHISKLEEKMALVPNDQWKIKRFVEKVTEDNKEFEQYQLKFLNFVKEEDQDTTDVEETTCDEHGSPVMEMFERLEQFEADEESMSYPTTATDPSHSLIKRLQYLEQKNELIIETTKEIASKPENHKRLHLKKKWEDISALSSSLSGLVGVILSLDTIRFF